jgi:hypothetical protein
VSGPTGGDDLPHDEHLRAALRHAPDRDAAAPAGLSERILAEARAAAPAPVAAARPGFVERWRGWWSRPVAAGAFASLLIAGFVGLMWREGPPPEALPGGDTAAPAAAPAPAPMAEQAPPAAAPTPLPPPQPQRPPERRREREATAAKPAAPAPAPAPAAAPPPPPPPLRAEQATTDRAAERADAAAPAKALPAPAAAPRPAAPSLGRLAQPAPDPLSAALTLLAGTADDQALRERLAALRTRVQSAWTPAAPPPIPPELLHSADGRPLGRLWIEPGRILWQDEQGRAWQAALAP